MLNVIFFRTLRLNRKRFRLLDERYVFISIIVCKKLVNFPLKLSSVSLSASNVNSLCMVLCSDVKRFDRQYNRTCIVVLYFWFLLNLEQKDFILHV